MTKKTELEGELSVIQSEIDKLNEQLRPLIERRREINNRIADIEDYGEEVAEDFRYDER